MEPFIDKAGYLRRYAARTRDRRAAAKRGWPARRTDIVAELKAWFEPLLELAGHIRAGVGGPGPAPGRRRLAGRHRLPGRPGSCLRRGVMPLPVHCPSPADRIPDRRPPDRLGQQPVPEHALPGPQDRPVQRVPVHLLQVPGARPADVRRRLVRRAEPRRTTTSSSQTGLSSAAAPTCGQTSAGSARPTAPRSPAPCTAGSSTCRPDAAWPPTPATTASAAGQPARKHGERRLEHLALTPPGHRLYPPGRCGSICRPPRISSSHLPLMPSPAICSASTLWNPDWVTQGGRVSEGAGLSLDIMAVRNHTASQLVAGRDRPA